MTLEGKSRFSVGSRFRWPSRQDLKPDRSPLKRIAERRAAATAQMEPRDLGDRRSNGLMTTWKLLRRGRGSRTPRAWWATDPADFLRRRCKQQNSRVFSCGAERVLCRAF